MTNNIIEEFDIEVTQNYLDNIERTDYTEQAVVLYNYIVNDKLSFTISSNLNNIIKKNLEEIRIILENFFNISGEPDYLDLADFIIRDYLNDDTEVQ